MESHLFCQRLFLTVPDSLKISRENFWLAEIQRISGRHPVKAVMNCP